MKYISFFCFFILFSTLIGQVEINSATGIRYLALGDSYTIGESVSENNRWPNQFKDSLINRGFTVDDFKIIATTGWTTSNLISGIALEQLDSNWNLVSLLIGVNNQFQNRPFSIYLQELPSLINQAIALAGGKKESVFLVSIPDYAYTSFGQSTGNQVNISAGIDKYNQAMDSIAGVFGVQYIYITDITRRGISESDLVANDGLHPSGKAYTEFVNVMLDDILNNNSTNLALKMTEDFVKITRSDDTIEFKFNKIDNNYNIEVISVLGDVLENHKSISASVFNLSIKERFGSFFIVNIYHKASIVKSIKIIK